MACRQSAIKAIGLDSPKLQPDFDFQVLYLAPTKPKRFVCWNRMSTSCLEF